MNVVQVIFYYLLTDVGDCHISGQLSNQELGIAKLFGFCEWLSIHPLIAEPDGATNLDSNSSSHKMIIFAHHHKVLNGVQVKNLVTDAYHPLFRNSLLEKHNV